MDEQRESTGLAHVATVSFLGSRAAPSAPFWLALPGGVALARVAARLGLRSGYGASAAAILQTVAVMGPARINNPLTQAITAPLLGRMDARGRPAWLQTAACFGLRFVHYTVLSAIYIWVVLGGLDAFTGSYETLTGWLGFVPQGEYAAVILAVAGNLAWAAIYSTIQVIVYRRALRGWPAGAGVAAHEPPGGPDEWLQRGRFDPRAVAVAATLATILLLSGTSWPLLAGVAVWLALAWAFSRADSGAVALGAGLGAMLAVSALTGSLLAGLGLDQALRRAVRAALLVAVATWLRAAAGPEGLREVFRRALRHLRRLPGAPEASSTLDGLDHGPRLIEAGRALVVALTPVDKKPAPIADAVTEWVAGEAAGFRAGGDGARPRLRLRPPDRVLVAFALLPALALVSPLT
jgi:hypothetical protein